MPPSVLLVESEEMVARFVTELLAERGFQVEVAASAGEALARVGAGEHALALTEKAPPDLGLAELLLRARALRPLLPWVVVAPTGSVRSALEALQAGASDYLLMAVDDVEALVERLRQAIQAPPGDPALVAGIEARSLPEDFREAMAMLRSRLRTPAGVT